MVDKRKSPTGGLGDPGVGPLINRLGPINNACRAAEGITKVELLWDLGDAVLAAYPAADDQLLRAISSRSYITRDLLRYALIVRRGWRDRADLRATFPALSRYTLFREALPFLKGERCGVGDELYAEILGRLNGSGDPTEAKEFLLGLKAKMLGRKHQKGQAKSRMTSTAAQVRAGVQAALIAAGAAGEAVAEVRRGLGDSWLLRLSQWCMAAADDTPFSSPENGDGLPDPYGQMATALARIGRANREDRAGFRKAVGVSVLMDGADLFHALRSEEGVEKWQARRAARLRV